MSGQVGWYPDPGGQPGMFRFWNGTAWSQELSPTPHAPAPGTGPARGQQPSAPGAQPQGGQYAPHGSNPYAVRQPRSGALWWVLGSVLALALIVGAVIILPQLLTGRSVIDTDPGGGGATPQSLCPPQPSEYPTVPPAQGDGRVHAGGMSYPELGSPWSAPSSETRVPFGRDAQTQTVLVEEGYDGFSSWVASVLIAELAAGDGFFSPEQGSEIVSECIVGSFYGDAEVTRDDQRNEAITIDGKDGWIVESHLTFDIEGLETKGETMIVVIVKTSDVTSALYYASIPDTTPELLQPAEDLIDELQVEG
ncbi:DUF2510 domain-containing protein [Naumannella halotolerans]|uniref:DUF2510 domain-containing protein n=1 Tax=Naumannella halotolerans TaxID=993414 RepID=UPI00370D91BD